MLEKMYDVFIFIFGDFENTHLIRTIIVCAIIVFSMYIPYRLKKYKVLTIVCLIVFFGFSTMMALCLDSGPGAYIHNRAQTSFVLGLLASILIYPISSIFKHQPEDLQMQLIVWFFVIMIYSLYSNVSAIFM